MPTVTGIVAPSRSEWLTFLAGIGVHDDHHELIADFATGTARTQPTRAGSFGVSLCAGATIARRRVNRGTRRGSNGITPAAAAENRRTHAALAKIEEHDQQSAQAILDEKDAVLLQRVVHCASCSHRPKYACVSCLNILGVTGRRTKPQFETVHIDAPREMPCDL